MPETSEARVWRVERGHADFPAVRARGASETHLLGRGRRDLLGRRASWVGVLASRRAASSLILRAQDWANFACDAGETGDVVWASGFHSPLEQEALRIGLRARMPLLGVLARSLDGARLDARWQAAIDASHMAALSPFSNPRLSRDSALARNTWLVGACSRLVILAAPPESALHDLVLQVLALEDAPRVEVLEHRAHEALVRAGAEVVKVN